MDRQEESALLIVGHGSTVNADSSRPTWAHAREIENRGTFAEVRCAFWKEEPSLRDALSFFRDDRMSEVYVVPNFISEGYFTQTVIPRELELNGRITERPGGQLWKYCEPVGSNPGVTELLLKRACEAGAEARDTSLLIVAHGTGLNDNSAVAAKREAEKIRARGEFAEVLNVYMEEPPLVSDWAKLARTRNIVVVPFFISDGLHSYEDIPEMLGIDRHSEPRASARPGHAEACPSVRAHELHGQTLYYTTAIGTERGFADLIVEQVAAFDRQNQHLHSLA